MVILGFLILFKALERLSLKIYKMKYSLRMYENINTHTRVNKYKYSYGDLKFSENLRNYFLTLCETYKLWLKSLKTLVKFYQVMYSLFVS